MLKPLKDWYADAYDFVQTACNLSGIVYSFDRLIGDLKEAGELRPNHPCIVLWVDKFDDLSRSRPLGALPCDTDIETVNAKLQAVMRRICKTKSFGTDDRNEHPDIQAVIRELVTLAGSRDILTFGKAYDEAADKAEAA